MWTEVPFTKATSLASWLNATNFVSWFNSIGRIFDKTEHPSVSTTRIPLFVVAKMIVSLSSTFKLKIEEKAFKHFVSLGKKELHK